MAEYKTPLLPPPPDPTDAIAAILAEPPRPWERRPGETEEDWSAFVVYRDQCPPRKVIGAGKGNTATAWARFKANDWEERVRAHDKVIDRYVEDERREFLAVTAKQRAADHLMLLKSVRETLMNEAQKWLEASRRSDMAGLWKPAELVKGMDLVVKLERLVTGESTENVQAQTVDLSKLSPADLEALDELYSKAEQATAAEPSDPAKRRVAT